ncbi:MAG: radical SAM/SPASM domain-containing protein [Rectinemataceae bacterium]
MFDKLFLEISSACNLSCSFCPPTSRRPEFMERDRFEFLLTRLSGFGDHLYFHLKGEPLLHPALGTFLAIAWERGFAVTLTTNGTLLGLQAKVLLGAPALRKLSVSLHSQVGLEELGEYWGGLSTFLDLHRVRPEFPLSLRLWNQVGGRLPAATGRLWELLGGRYPALRSLDPGGNLPRGLRLDEGVYLNPANQFEWPALRTPGRSPASGSDSGPGSESPGRNAPESVLRPGNGSSNEIRVVEGRCHGLRTQLGILVDGRVVPCCLDSEGAMSLGNLREQPLGEILASPRARAIRLGFQRHRIVEELCQSCGYRKRFDKVGAARE